MRAQGAVEVGAAWTRTSAKGVDYLSGAMGRAELPALRSAPAGSSLRKGLAPSWSLPVRQGETAPDDEAEPEG